MKHEVISVAEVEAVCRDCMLAVSHNLGCPALTWIAKARRIAQGQADLEQVDQEHRLWPEMDVDVPEE